MREVFQDTHICGSYFAAIIFLLFSSQIINGGNKLTQKMKKHAVIFAIHAKHSDLEISQFMNVVRSFVHKVRRELEASDGNVESVAKRRKQTSFRHS